MQFIDLKRQYRVLKTQIDAGVEKVLSEARFIGGEEVRTLETELASYCGVKHCITCANGTDALTLALKCLGAGKGDAIFVPTFTFFASAETIALEGATPVFVDVNAETFNLDAEKLEEAIKRVLQEGVLRPRAVMAVDLFGQPADYGAIRKIAGRYGLPIIEDGAQGFGGAIGGKKACGFGDISTTSFFPAKPLGCYGDGGAVFTDDDRYAELLRSLAVHGKGGDKYDNVRVGCNSRLDTVQAAILLVKLKAFRESEFVNRNRVAEYYDSALRGEFATPYVPSGFESSWAQYTLILKDGQERAEIQNRLKAKGIPSMVYYPIPMHLQTAFSGLGYREGDFPAAEKLCETVLSLPMHPYLEEDEMKLITDALIEYSAGNH